MRRKIKKSRRIEHCVWKVREILTPYSGHYKCLRLIVAVPNMLGHRPFSSEPAVSLQRKFLLYQSSDFHPEQLQEVTEKCLKELRFRGFKVIEEVEVYEERMIFLMRPVKVDHIEVETN